MRKIIGLLRRLRAEALRRASVVQLRRAPRNDKQGGEREDLSHFHDFDLGQGNYFGISE